MISLNITIKLCFSNVRSSYAVMILCICMESLISLLRRFDRIVRALASNCVMNAGCCLSAIYCSILEFVLKSILGLQIHSIAWLCSLLPTSFEQRRLELRNQSVTELVDDSHGHTIPHIGIDMKACECDQLGAALTPLRQVEDAIVTVSVGGWKRFEEILGET